ncbi:recombinase family protein [Persicitalea jodogahamensis]|uniref:Resolvase/invertase-type recombinase catalytic domain-containing protein n=1 Tax=Persicitalea jodogahamensis TaxID=402147 RepID=A0A8J3DFT0_9BACT|nr:recombinase family protein [Persicitalea jodogahamensis]GHB87463.1 hypothetical protein GCM10007390_49190 [Persicitalea jodogahamensis]
MKIAYIRTALDDQEKEEKLKELQKLGYDSLRLEGEIPKNGGLTELEKIVVSAVKGDVLCINSLMELGRTLDETVRYVNRLMEKGVAVFSVADNVETSDTDPELNIKMLSPVSDRDRQKLVTSIRAGRKAAEARGIKFGRKKGLTEPFRKIAPEVYRLSQQKGQTIDMICEKFSIGSRNTYYRIVEYQKEKEQHKREERERHTANMKLFYFDIETTGPEPALDSIHHLAIIVEVNGHIKLRDSLLIQPREMADLPEDYQTPGSKITKAELANTEVYSPPAQALAKLCQILERYVDPANPADRFFVVGFATEQTKVPFLRELFEEGPQRYEDYFYIGSMDARVLATQYLWSRRAEFKEFSLPEVFEALGGSRTVKKVLVGKHEHDATSGVEMARQVYKHITTDKSV